MVSVLLHELTDPTMRNSRQETPLDLAALYGRLEVRGIGFIKKNKTEMGAAFCCDYEHIQVYALKKIKFQRTSQSHLHIKAHVLQIFLMFKSNPTAEAAGNCSRAVQVCLSGDE